MKYDDVDWHESSALSPRYAAAHIALFFVWLINNGYVDATWLKECNLKAPLSKKKSPIYYLFEYADGKIIDQILTEEGKLLCDRYYDQYSEDYTKRAIKGFWYLPSDDSSPYTGKDIWWNVRSIDRYLKKKLQNTN